MAEPESTTLERILEAANAEFLEKGCKTASLRSIVKSAVVTTGAFYGYFASKEELFAALVGESYRYVIDNYRAAVFWFETLPPEKHVEKMGDVGKDCMQKLIACMDTRRDIFRLILQCSEGTPYSVTSS